MTLLATACDESDSAVAPTPTATTAPLGAMSVVEVPRVPNTAQIIAESGLNQIFADGGLGILVDDDAGFLRHRHRHHADAGAR